MGQFQTRARRGSTHRATTLPKDFIFRWYGLTVQGSAPAPIDTAWQSAVMLSWIMSEDDPTQGPLDQCLYDFVALI